MQNKAVYRNTMGSCLLLLGRHNSNCGTMNLFEIVEEEWNEDETKVVYARMLFQIRFWFVYKWLFENKRKPRPRITVYP